MLSQNATPHTHIAGMSSSWFPLISATITMDVINEDGKISMYVQWLIMESDDAEKAGEIIKGRMEKWIGRIFG